MKSKKPKVTKTTRKTIDQAEEEYRHQQEADLNLQRRALSEVPICTIGMMAATLSRPDIPAEEAVKKVYKILEWATFGQLWLAGKTGDFCYGSGVIRAINFQLPPDITDEEIEKMETINSLQIRDDNEEVSGLHFDRSLKVALPKVRKLGDRLARFRRWLQETQELAIGEIGDRFALWKKEGIPESLFAEFYRGNEAWWPVSERNRKSRNQKERRVKKKRKARPPVEKLREIGRIIEGENRLKI